MAQADSGAPARFEARRPARLPVLIHVVMFAVMVLVLLPLVLRVAQTAPPTIAEFAPQIQHSIQHAPPGQSSQFGNAPGSGTAGQPSPSPVPSPTIPQGARVSQCVGDPPRQVEDPQSPPCVPFWSGNNGGATTPGVDGSTITIAVPQWLQTSGAGDIPAMAKFFSDRFELYNRTLHVVYYADSGVFSNPNAMQADAVKVKTAGAFADLGYPWQYGGETDFYDDLAREGIVSVEETPLSMPWADEAHLAAMAPYEWNYAPAPDIVERNLAEMICRQLAGKRPTHAGTTIANDPTVTKRVFGILRGTVGGLRAVDYHLLQDGIAACTGAAPVEVDFTSGSQQEIANAVATMNTQHVTSVICLCHGSDLDVNVMTAAQGQGYIPEWLVSNIIGLDELEGEYIAGSSAPEEANHVFGIRSENKDLPVADLPYIWAVHYESPSNPKPPYQNYENIWDQDVYHDLLVLASGIQMAGPHLTAHALQTGLFNTQFPNPGCNGPPYYQACVGFPDGEHTMQQSFAEVWWDENQTNRGSPAGYKGDFCYYGVGVRHYLGDWPADDRFGEYPCN